MVTTACKHVVDCTDDRGEFEALCGALRADPCRQPEQFVREAAAVADRLPEAIRRALCQFRHDGNHEGVMLLRGLPSEPEASGLRGFAASRGEAFLAIIGSHIGDLIGYIQEQDGALFHDVIPDQSLETEQCAAGSTVRLELHTERCFHPYLPDHVLLYCVRPDHQRTAATEYASIRKILPLLSTEDVPVLFESLFRTGVDYSFGNVTAQKGNGPVLSVLHGHPQDPFLRCDFDLMVGLTPAAQKALGRLEGTVEQVRTCICLEPGDLLIIDNRRTVHGRSAFHPRYDGRDRWLKRAYVVGDLSASAADRNPGERVIRTRFEPTG